jgi:NADPH-dependent glutamate synthase beta subunit-like oxidoreductase
MIQEYRKTKIIPNKSFFNDISYYLEAFVARVFQIESEVLDLQKRDNLYVNLHKCHKDFIIRRVLHKNDNISDVSFVPEFIPEHIFADRVVFWMQDEEKYHAELSQAEEYARYMILNSESAFFRDIGKVDYANLLQEPVPSCREGFDLTDHGCSSAFAIKQAHYCLYCHHRDKDSCSAGLYKKGNLEENFLGNRLTGCPLGQKISEMNEAKAQGFSIASLAIITMDNPMVAVTGHRICNDCKKSCIFQKQEPVEIPQIETKILRDVLSLSKGEEIYELLTKWNPLKADDYLPAEYSGKKILIVGMGPAGFSLAYYLLHAGCNVIAIDGNYKFGGVAEYGITARWDKKFLDLIFKILNNYENFEFKPAVRFGSNITYSQAKELGFEKIALCTGAGAPKILDIPGITYKGVKTAADFLMSINRFKDTSPLIPNILLRMPIAIIGGGLSAIDAATEALAYYKIQVQEFAQRYDPAVDLTEEEVMVAQEFLSHAKEIQEFDDYVALQKKWGGATIYYYKDTKKSGAYRINHEELQYALNEGVDFVANHEAIEIIADKYGSAKSIRFLDHGCGAEVEINAKSIMMAVGIESSNKDSSVGDEIYVFGDADPEYEGSVVKAIASVKNGYKKLLDCTSPNISKEHDLTLHLSSVEFLSEDLVEFLIHSSLQVENFNPGQFFKLQNQDGEFAALNVSKIDYENGNLSLVLRIKGSSTYALSKLKAGDKIHLLGPLGDYVKIEERKKILLIGEQVANYGLIPIAEECVKLGCNILHIAIDLEPSQESGGSEFISSEEFENRIGSEDLSSYDSIISALFPANLKILQKYSKGMNAITAVHSIMQCMMGGVCGSCFQKNKSGYSFSCQKQYQNLRELDLDHLQNKLQQNSLIEKIVR